MAPQLKEQLPNSEIESFEGHFKLVSDSIVEIISNLSGWKFGVKNGQSELQDLLLWTEKLMKHNVPNGKKIRGRMLVAAYHTLVENPTKDVTLANILGWCVEILQAAFLVADDIMDNGETRRGLPCWFRVNNMGNIAFNDALLLEHIVYQLLKKHFGTLPVYPAILQSFTDITFYTVVGQSIDTRKSNEKNFHLYSMSMYMDMIVFKTAYYSVFLPISLAMLLSGIARSTENQKLWETVEEVAINIGYLFQAQDDYLDSFGDKEHLGKSCNDAKEGKCTWLFVKAKELSSESEKEELYKAYGSNEEEKLQFVKNFYHKKDLQKEFVACQFQLNNEIKDLIAKIENVKIQKILTMFLQLIFKRTK